MTNTPEWEDKTSSSISRFQSLTQPNITPFPSPGNYITRQRGWHDHKGKGQLPTYWLCGQGDTLLSSYTKEELTEEEAKKQVNDVLEQVSFQWHSFETLSMPLVYKI